MTKLESRVFTSELAIIGTGLAGFAAGTYALERGIETAQAGNTGALAYTTGYLDLMGSGNADQYGSVMDPWKELGALSERGDSHPLARISSDDITTAFTSFTDFLKGCGIAYSSPGEKNVDALTPAGTLKKTLCVPKTMVEGVEALAQKSECVIIDFKGLRGFSARQVAANLRAEWPGIRAERVSFPDMEMGEIYPEVMARALEVSDCRVELAKRIKKVVGQAVVVGIPAVMGIHDPDVVKAHLEQELGLPIFEIPTMPPAVPGIRLREIFEQVFPQKGVRLVPQQKVKSIDFGDEFITLGLEDNYGPIVINAKSVILATGRFLSGGLEADMNRVMEPLIGLPVTQPVSREKWFQEQYIGTHGHEVNRCGIEVDEKFRPLGSDGKIVDERLFAAGILLAHQDWIRGRCGAGVALATAYKAVEYVHEYLQS